jgi:multiple sugar transport system permease protein
MTRRRERREDRLTLARHTTLWFTGVIVVLPVAIFAAMSLLTRQAVLSGRPRLGDLTLDYYRQLFARLDVPKLLGDSLLLAVLSSLAALAIGTAVSYFVSRGGGTLPEQIYTLCLSVWFVPPVALSLEVYLWFQRVGLYDRLSGLTLLYAAVHASLAAVLLAPYWDAVPRRIDEAAWIDGWYGFEVPWRIHLPALLPPLAGVLALAFLRSWNELLFASILTDRRVSTLPVAMLGLTTGSHIEWGQIAALGTIALLPAPLAGAVLWMVFRGISPGARWRGSPESA